MGIDECLGCGKITWWNLGNLLTIGLEAGARQIEVVDGSDLLVRIAEALDVINKIACYDLAVDGAGKEHIVFQMKGVGLAFIRHVPGLGNVSHQLGLVLDIGESARIGDQLAGDCPQDLPGIGAVTC